MTGTGTAQTTLIRKVWEVLLSTKPCNFLRTNNPTTIVVWNFFFFMEASRIPLGWPIRLDFLFAWILWEKLMFQHRNCSFMPIYGHDFTTYCAPLWHIVAQCDTLWQHILVYKADIWSYPTFAQHFFPYFSPYENGPGNLGRLRWE